VVLDAWIKHQGKDAFSFLFPSTRGGRLSAHAVQHLVAKHARAARKICPSLSKKTLAHMCFDTMYPSGLCRVMESLCRFRSEISDRVVQSLETSPDIVLCPLQTVQEGEESVVRFIATRRSMRRGCFNKCFFLHGKCRFEINLCGFNTFVAEPQCDYRTIDACLQ
jgi:hypothetical protein